MHNSKKSSSHKGPSGRGVDKAKLGKRKVTVVTEGHAEDETPTLAASVLAALELGQAEEKAAAEEDRKEALLAEENRRRQPHRATEVPDLHLPPFLRLKGSLELPLKLGTNHDHEAANLGVEAAEAAAAGGDHQIHHHLSHHFHAKQHSHAKPPVSQLVLGMPGNLSLDAKISETYFTPAARDKFFEQYRWVDSQRKITHYGPGDTTALLYFTNSSVSSAVDAPPVISVPFGVTRPSTSGAASIAHSTSTYPFLSSLASGDGVAGGLGSIIGSPVKRVDAKLLATELVSAATPWKAGTRSGGINGGMHSQSAPALIASASKQHHNHHHANTSSQSAEPFLAPSNPDALSGVSTGKFSRDDITSDDKYEILHMLHATDQLDRRGRPSVLHIPATVHSPDFVHTFKKEAKTYKKKPRYSPRSPPKQSRRHKSPSPPRDATNSNNFLTSSAMGRPRDGFFHRRQANVDATDVDEMEQVMLQSQLLREGEDLHAPPLSPRTIYLAACAREGINPRAGMVLRKGFTKSLNLRHQSLGDKMGLILAECLPDMPHLHSLILDDNRLTDVSLGPLLKQIVKMKDFLELDLSNNKLDEVASQTLAEYLGSTTCPLEKLVIRNADVDDLEGANFIQILCSNEKSRLRELDLSQNLLGSAEQLSSVIDNVVTTGVAFGKLFHSKVCSLERVSVSWNLIRLASGVAMASSLGANTSLTELDLSSNGLGTDGGLALAASLMSNHTLRSVNLANNNLDGQACFALCAAVCENKVLRRVVFDDNPIGSLGARALMQVPTVVGSRISLSARGCNTTIVQSNPHNFDFDKILHTYTITLSNPFDRAVAIFLLNLVACHHTFIFTRFDVDHSPTNNGKFEPVELVPYLCADKEMYFDERQIDVKDTLEGLLEACSDREMAKEFFDEVDEDKSGELEPPEFRSLLLSIGIEIDNEQLDEVFEFYDTDQGGTIGLSEFLVFLKKQHEDVTKRLEDHLHSPALIKKGAARIMSNGRHDPKAPKYLPPAHGRAIITVEDGFARKAIYRTLSACDKMHIEAVSAHSTDPSSMTAHGVAGAKLRVEEAYVLYKQMVEETGNKVRVLVSLLPQLAQPQDARLLVTKALSGDRLEMMKLKSVVGSALRPLMGLCNGFYLLDLSNPFDRMCLTRLLEVSSTRADDLRANCRVPIHRFSSDFSQKKNDNNCFRNEVYTPAGEEPRFITVNNHFASPIPTSGTLSFDFSGGNRPTEDDMVASDARVVKTLASLYLLDDDMLGAAMRKLARLKRQADRCLEGKGVTLYECEWERALKIGQAKVLFYDSKTQREEQMRVALEVTEEVSFAYDSRAAIAAAVHVSDAELVKFIVGDVDLLKDETENLGSIYRVKSTTSAATSNSDGDSVSEECKTEETRAQTEAAGGVSSDGRSSPTTAEEADPAATFQNNVHATMDEYQRKFRLLLLSSGVSTAAKAARMIDALDAALNKQWLLSRHLALVCELFAHLGSAKRTSIFGTYRVDIVVMLFERLVDTHNFDLVLRVLTPYEVACVIARIGWLNIFCPMKPEGCIELNLGVYEERQIAKMVNVLATVEPGENWPVKQFKWKYQDECMPGWELKLSWMEDLPNGAGLPERGFMALQYYAGDGKMLNGCRPHVKLRKALMHLVNMSEVGMRIEEEEVDEGIGKKDSDGITYIKQNLEAQWRPYLCK